MASVATAFMIITMVAFLFPAAPAPVAQSMNYIVVVGEIIILTTVYYLISGNFGSQGSSIITLVGSSVKKRSDEKLSITSTSSNICLMWRANNNINFR